MTNCEPQMHLSGVDAFVVDEATIFNHLMAYLLRMLNNSRQRKHFLGIAYFLVAFFVLFFLGRWCARVRVCSHVHVYLIYLWYRKRAILSLAVSFRYPFFRFHSLLAAAHIVTLHILFRIRLLIYFELGNTFNRTVERSIQAFKTYSSSSSRFLFLFHRISCCCCLCDRLRFCSSNWNFYFSTECDIVDVFCKLKRTLFNRKNYKISKK